MAQRGTEHERVVAKDKLARLEANYDFDAPVPQATDDVFAAWGTPSASRDDSPLITIPAKWQDVGNVVKWIFQDKFGISSSWRVEGDTATIRVAAQKADVVRLRPLATSLCAGVRAICETYFSGPTTELDRAPFLSGFYEGLLDEAPATGRIVPGRTPVAKKKKKRTKAHSAPHSAALHPYDQGRALGKQMRINVPVETLCENIRLSLAEPDED